MILWVGFRIYPNLPVVAIKFISVVGKRGFSSLVYNAFQIILRFAVLPDDADVF